MRQWAFILGVIASLSAFGEPTGHGRHERLYSLSDADRLASVQEIIDRSSKRERRLFAVSTSYVKPDTDWVIDINPSLLRSYLLREWVDSGLPVNVDAEGVNQESALLEAARGIDSLTIELPLAGRDGVREITFYVDEHEP